MFFLFETSITDSRSKKVTNKQQPRLTFQLRKNCVTVLLDSSDENVVVNVVAALYYFFVSCCVGEM